MEHTYHADIHQHGLADGCPRCDEHAEQPWFSLDGAMLEDLVRRTQTWRRDPFAMRPRTETEHKAMRNIERHLRILDRIEKYIDKGE